MHAFWQVVLQEYPESIRFLFHWSFMLYFHAHYVLLFGVGFMRRPGTLVCQLMPDNKHPAPSKLVRTTGTLEETMC